MIDTFTLGEPSTAPARQPFPIRGGVAAAWLRPPAQHARLEGSPRNPERPLDLAQGLRALTAPSHRATATGDPLTVHAHRVLEAVLHALERKDGEQLRGLSIEAGRYFEADTERRRQNAARAGCQLSTADTGADPFPGYEVGTAHAAYRLRQVIDAELVRGSNDYQIAQAIVIGVLERPIGVALVRPLPPGRLALVRQAIAAIGSGERRHDPEHIARESLIALGMPKAQARNLFKFLWKNPERWRS